MSLIGLVITLIVVGILLYLLNVYIPMDATIKRIINIVVIIAVVFFLLSATGILHHAGDVKVPTVK